MRTDGAELLTIVPPNQQCQSIEQKLQHINEIQSNTQFISITVNTTSDHINYPSQVLNALTNISIHAITVNHNSPHWKHLNSGNKQQISYLQ